MLAKYKKSKLNTKQQKKREINKKKKRENAKPNADFWIIYITKINKPLANLMREKREKTQIISIRNERVDIIIDFIYIKSIKR